MGNNIFSLCSTFAHMTSIRQNKVNRLIQKELGSYFQRFSALYGAGMITVTNVNIGPDLSHAKVYLSFFPSHNAPGMLASIEERYHEIRKELGSRVGKQLRIVPDLSFYIDDSLDYAERIENLLKK